MQGPVFSDKGPLVVLPASPGFPHPCFPGSHRDQKEKVYEGDQPEVHPQAAGLGSQKQEEGGLLTIYLSGRQAALDTQKPICCAQSDHARLQGY